MSKSLNQNPISCKVILVGDSGVGKTSIIGRFINRYNEKEKSTLGASFSNKIDVIDNYKISFDIWDTAGQEKFRSVNSIFYKEAYVCILVYDITTLESFKSIKNYWYKTIMENCSSNIILGLAGNKIDLYENEEVNKKEAKEYCKSINALFFSTSAVLNSSIDEMFRSLGKKFISSNTFKQFKDKFMENEKKNINLNKKDNKRKTKKKCC